MSSDHEHLDRPSRRQFLQVAGGAAGALLAGGTAHAHHHGRPTPQSLNYLDQKMYLNNMELVAFVPPTKPGAGRNVGEMMAIGKQRLLQSSGQLLDVSDPRHPQVFNSNAPGGKIAYNNKLKKWLFFATAETPPGMYTTPFGKYEMAKPTAGFRADKSFRGIRMWDATNPANITQLGELNTGPTGMGCHGENYWDGGNYVFVACAPDDSYVNQLSCIHPLSHGMSCFDLSDPANLKELSRWWVPGQRAGEMAQLKKWRCVAGRANNLPDKAMTLEETIEAFKTGFKPALGTTKGFPAWDRMPYTNFHGGAAAPKRIEDGGKYVYGAWSAFGMLIHDVSDPRKPKLVGAFDPTPNFGNEGIPFHTIWTETINRGFVVSIAESLNPDCNEVWLENWLIDVRDPTNPYPVSRLPRPKAPPDAEFTDFCYRRGRFSVHNISKENAPGRAPETFLALEYFNAGLQCYDLTDTANPKIAAYFVPPMGGTLSPECTVPAENLPEDLKLKCVEESLGFVRPCNSTFVEWDRRLLYAGTTTGLYILSCSALGPPILEPMAVQEWSLPKLNLGAP